MVISKAAQKRYLDNPNRCPFCKSQEISGGDFDSDGSQVWRDVDCESCGKIWTEVFSLTHIDNLQKQNI